jgi:multiple sugar transport system permease protein
VKSTKRDSTVAGWVMLAPFLIFFVMFAIIPIVLAIKESLGPSMQNEAGGIKNYWVVLNDFRFTSAAKNTAIFMLISAPVMTVVVLGLALLLDTYRAKWHQYIRLAYLIPGCYVGAAGVLVWYAALEPIIGPFRNVLNFFGIESQGQIFNPTYLPLVFAMMAVVANAGGWIVVQFGGLQEISEEVIEAAKIDGCGNFQLATKIKLPLIKKNVVYMVVLVVAASVQIFAEPYIVTTAIFRGVAENWSLNQLSYSLAFTEGDFAGASAVSVMLLIVCLFAALILIFKTKFFETGDETK